jgi:hypothetical protein
MGDYEKTAIAAHLYITLRRSANRVIDVEWLAKNEEYAKEIIRLARAQDSDELKHYADLFEEEVFGKPAPAKPSKPPAEELSKPPMDEPAEEGDPDEDEDLDPDRYIGHLR